MISPIEYTHEVDIDWKLFCKDPNSCGLVYDYVQKITYSVQDLNNEIISLGEPTLKDVLYVISLVCWISDAVDKISEYGLETYVKNYNEEENTRAFLSAIRSFVLAHPIGTDRHKKYGLDGSKICVDVRSSSVAKLSMENENFLELRIDGLKPSLKKDGDYYLSIYTEDDNYKDMKFVACFFEDLYHIAQVRVNQLCSIEKSVTEGIRHE